MAFSIGGCPPFSALRAQFINKLHSFQDLQPLHIVVLAWWEVVLLSRNLNIPQNPIT